MGEHTPGPWSAFYKSKYDEWHVSLPVPGRGMKLALAPDGIQSGNREADARLIASAPDLLAALQGAIGALEFSRDFHSDLGNEEQAFAQDRLDAAISAIAKATGEATA